MRRVGPSVPSIDWYDLGWTDYLNGRHMPDRKCRLYPTQDTHSTEDERRFLAGWRAAKVECERRDAWHGALPVEWD